MHETWGRPGVMDKVQVHRLHSELSDSISSSVSDGGLTVAKPARAHLAQAVRESPLYSTDPGVLGSYIELRSGESALLDCLSNVLLRSIDSAHYVRFPSVSQGVGTHTERCPSVRIRARWPALRMPRRPNYAVRRRYRCHSS